MRVVKRAGVGALLLAAAALAGPAFVGAETSGSSKLLNLQAGASGVHVIVAMPDFVVVDRFIDGGGPTAQASLSTLEGPASYAAQPYPGEVAIAFPGLMKVVGFPVDVPPYPFYVNASATKPEEKRTQPGSELSATATATDAAASAQSGQNSDQTVLGHARSTARTWRDGQIYRSESQSTGDLFQLGPLRLLGMKSRAAASIPAEGGAATLSSSLEVAAASVNDVPVTFTPEGVTLAGSKVPLPRDNPITKGLEQAGISVEYLAASTTDSTVVAPGLRIRAVQTFPGVDKQLQVSYLIGQSVAHAAVSTVAGDGGLPTPDLPITGDTPGFVPPAAGEPGSSGPDGATVTGSGPDSSGATGLGRIPTGSGSGTGLTSTGAGNEAPPSTGGSAGDTTAGAEGDAGAAAGAGLDSSLALSEADLPKTSATSIYLVVAGAAMLAALALHALRQLGVRAPARIGG